jgi:hypothetical protein
MVSFGFRLPRDISEVEVAVAHWNKVSPASPHIVGIRFGVNEGPVRVSVARLVGSLRILAVGV